MADWPLAVLPPRDFSFDIAFRSISTPAAANGFTQVVASDLGIWVATYTGIPVTDTEKLLQWRCIASDTRGRLNPIVVPFPICHETDIGLLPVPDGTTPDDLDIFVPHSDTSPFSDTTLYHQSAVHITTVGSIPVRGTSVIVNVGAGAPPQCGMVFSIGERLYRVEGSSSAGGDNYLINFQPGARDAVEPGEVLNFTDPICRMRLATDNEMHIEMGYGKWSFPTVSFIEDV